MTKYSLVALFCALHIALYAQVPTRSGFSAPANAVGGSAQAQRQFPCDGTALLSENFDSTPIPAIPTGWRALDFDNGTPNVNVGTQYSSGWQSSIDYKGKSATVMTSLAWYTDTALRANNWLISPAVVLTGTRNCVSWYAYSQDFYYPESYRVRVARHANDTAAFTTLIEVEREFYTLNYRSVQLPDSFKAGDTAYIAFQHISKNRFVLALDSIRVAAVKGKDIGAFGLLPTYIKKEGDSAKVSVGIRNYGGDTLTLDTSLVLKYSVNGGLPVAYNYAKSRKILPPNDTIWVALPKYWVGGDTGAYEICVWTEGVTDELHANDTSCNKLYVGFTTGIENALARSIQVFPNPATTQLNLRTEQAGTWQLLDMVGAVRAQQAILSQGELSFDISSLPAGLYLWKFQAATGEALTGKWQKQ